MNRIDYSVLKRALRGDVSEEEARAVRAWREESPEREAFWRRMEALARRVKEGGSGEMGGEVDVEAAWRRWERGRWGMKVGKGGRWWRVAGRVAAAVVVLVGVGLAWRVMDAGWGTGGDGGDGKGLPPLEPGMAMAMLHTSDGETVVLEGEGEGTLWLGDSTRVGREERMLVYGGGDGGDSDGGDGGDGGDGVGAGAKEGRGGEDGGKRGRVQWHRLEVPRGAEFNTRLSDGTMVQMNSESELTYPAVFGEGTRRVRLRGEAYFEVTSTGAPFVIEAGGMEVRVLGTRFNVYAYEEEGLVATTLEEGSVEVRAEGERLLLVPGEQATLTSDGGLEKRRVETWRFTAWREGEFVFEDERLEDVLNRVARWYNLTLFYSGQAARDTRINGRISRYEDFSILLEKLELLDLVDFEIKGKTVTVRSK